MIYEGIEYDIDKELSLKDFTGRTVAGKHSGKIIYASCFSQETPDTQIFDKGVKDITFVKCNLMNVKLPRGSTVIDCQTQQFKCQNDGEDWVLDDEKKPAEPLNKKLFERLGLSIDPKDIPKEKRSESVVIAKMFEVK